MGMLFIEDMFQLTDRQTDRQTISYPESSGFLVSGWAPGETRPLTKKPEDSGYEIDRQADGHLM